MSPVASSTWSNTMPETGTYWMRCWDYHPSLYGFLWISTCIFYLAVLVLSVRHLKSIYSAPISMQRVYYVRLASVPLVFATLTLIEIYDIRAQVLAESLKLMYEANIIATLVSLIFMLLSKQAAERHESIDGANVVGMMTCLEQQGPKKHFAVPPLGCCFAPCMQPHTLTARQLVCMNWLMWQYTLFAPTLAIVSLWMASSMSYELYAQYRHYPAWLLKVSGLLAMYCLNVLRKSTGWFIAQYNPNMKFWSFKMLILVTLFQRSFFKLILPPLFQNTGHCISSGGDGTTAAINLAAYWLLLFECIIGCFLARRAFPPSEIVDYRTLSDHGAVEAVWLDLEQFAEDTKEDKSDDSEEDSEEPDSGKK